MRYLLSLHRYSLIAHSYREQPNRLATSQRQAKYQERPTRNSPFTPSRYPTRSIIINQKQNKIMSEIEAEVKAIIVEKLGVDENEVTPEASFTNDLGADSLDTVELIMEFEKKFSITIPDTDSENIQTVEDAIEYIEAHIAPKA